MTGGPSRDTTERYLRVIAARRATELVVTTMTAAKLWPRISDEPTDVNYLPSAMSHASDIAIGLALADRARSVLCVNGDGSLLMNLGTLVTAVAAGAANLTMFLLVNSTYRIVGGSPIPGSDSTDFEGLARSAGWPTAVRYGSAAELDAGWSSLLAAPGPRFARLDVADPPSLDERLPRWSPGDSLRAIHKLSAC